MKQTNNHSHQTQNQTRSICVQGCTGVTGFRVSQPFRLSSRNKTGDTFQGGGR